MAKFNPKTIQNLDNPNTAVAQVNYNFDALRILIDSLLSRDGAAPNAMQSSLDMNNNRILNLPVPVSPTEPARHGDIQQYVDLAEFWANGSEASAISSAASAALSEMYYTSFVSKYLGEYPEPPTQDPMGFPVLAGALYFDTTRSTLYVHAIDRVAVIDDTVIAGSDTVLVSHWVPLPVPTFEQLNDVDLSTAQNGWLLKWTGTTVVGVEPSADEITQDNPLYDGGTVQDALDEVFTRSSLGIYDVFIFAQGLPGNDEETIRINASRTFYLPVNAGLSTASLRAAPSGSSVVFSIRKNGTSVGTITFADTSNSGVFSVPGEVTYNQGDVLSLTAPSTVNLAVRDLAVTLACVR